MKKIVQELKPENIRKNTAVTKIKRVNGKVHLYDDKGNEEVFDSVVSLHAFDGIGAILTIGLGTRVPR